MREFTNDMINDICKAKEALPKTGFEWGKYEMPCCIKQKGRWVKYTNEIPRAPGKICTYRNGIHYIYVSEFGCEYRYKVTPAVKQLLGL